MENINYQNRNGFYKVKISTIFLNCNMVIVGKWKQFVLICCRFILEKSIKKYCFRACQRKVTDEMNVYQRVFVNFGTW